jgi:hypothetical protein
MRTLAGAIAPKERCATERGSYSHLVKRSGLSCSFSNSSQTKPFRVELVKTEYGLDFKTLNYRDIGTVCHAGMVTYYYTIFIYVKTQKEA